MYLSHPVRRMRDDPLSDEEASLVVEPDESMTADDLRAAVADVGGTVDAELEFDCYLVRLPETAVADLCAVEGLDRVETADTISLGVEPGAEETVEPGDEGATDTDVEPDCR